MAFAQQTAELSLKLEKCSGYLQNLKKLGVNETFVLQFKMFLQSFSDSLSDLQRVVAMPCNRPCHSKVRLCLSQMVKTLRLCNSYPLTRQTVWYLSERLQWCVTELSRSLSDGVTDEPNNSFVHLMDLAVQQVDRDRTILPTTVHDLVRQAVTIAKLALPTDCKEINLSCQKLLVESNSSTAETSFLGDVLSLTLNTLEQRVNISVLRLFLEVFSVPNKPLKQLVNQCGKASHPRSLIDLDIMVEELDTHIERIMLVGQYTVTCCESTTLRGKLKCCLASMESVDNYLVPAVTAFFLDPDCADKRALVKLICDHWQQELSSLHSLVDLIVDIQAFTKVVEESLKELIERCRAQSDCPALYRAVISQGLLLHKHLSSSPDAPISVRDISILKKALHRCESTLQHCDSRAAAMYVKEIVRLVECFSESIDKFYNHRLSDATNSTIATISPDGTLDRGSLTAITAAKDKFPRTPITSQKFNNSVKDCGEFSKIESNDTEKTGAQNLLTPYLQRVGERSTTLYVRTPRKVLQSLMMNCSAGTEESVYGSLALDVTDVLENLSKLSSTLNSNHDKQNSVSMSYATNEPIISLDSLEISIPQRMRDLQHLDDKLRILKTS